jgi:nicotinamide mononucleotide (NMN) deamidase PncC
MSIQAMALSHRELIDRIHASPRRFVFSAAGGGSGALAEMLAVPGASHSVLEAVIPYSHEAIQSWLGGRPDHFCSERTARAMAMVAFRRAMQLSGGKTEVAGLGCTASLASTRPKAGPHRIHVAVQTAAVTGFWSLELAKGQRTREEEEIVSNALALNAAAEACEIAERVEVPLLEGEQVVESRTVAPPAWRDLLLGRTEMICEGNAAKRNSPNALRAVFPGEFNPLHQGHRRMASMAQELLGVPVEFEIAIANVEKPPLDYFEIERRMQQFMPDQAVWLTRCARFADKARVFAGACFVVGIDTLRRIASPRFYGDNESACLAAIDQIVARGCRFLVFGRNLGTGFVSLSDIDIPRSLRAVCMEVTSDLFREDISSTWIRRSGQW